MLLETLSNEDGNEDDDGIRQWHWLQNTINARANEQSCKEINHILQNYNVNSPDLTLCRERELEDANQFIFRSPRKSLFHFLSFQSSESEWQFKSNKWKHLQ